MKKRIKEYLYDHHLNHVMNKMSNNEFQHIYGIDKNTIHDDWEINGKEVWKKDNPNYKALSIKKVVTCEGCKYNYLGQRDHMDIGGCLYINY